MLILNHATRKYRRLFFTVGCAFSLCALSVYLFNWVPNHYGLEQHIAALLFTSFANYMLFKSCLQLSTRWKTSIIITALFTNFFVMTSLILAAFEYYK